MSWKTQKNFFGIINDTNSELVDLSSIEKAILGMCQGHETFKTKQSPIY